MFADQVWAPDLPPSDYIFRRRALPVFVAAADDRAPKLEVIPRVLAPRLAVTCGALPLETPRRPPDLAGLPTMRDCGKEIRACGAHRMKGRVGQLNVSPRFFRARRRAVAAPTQRRHQQFNGDNQ